MVFERTRIFWRERLGNTDESSIYVYITTERHEDR